MLKLFLLLAFASLCFGQNITTDNSFCPFLKQLAVSPGYASNSTSTSLLEARDFIYSGLKSIDLSLYNSWGVPTEAVDQLLKLVKGKDCSDDHSAKPFTFHPFKPAMEGPLMAPNSHPVVYNSNTVGVIHWWLHVGEREPFHTHGLASVMFFTQPAGSKYFDETGKQVSSKPPTRRKPTDPIPTSFANPEWLHSVENADDHDYRVVRIEFKPVGLTNYHWPPGEDLGP